MKGFHSLCRFSVLSSLILLSSCNQNSNPQSTTSDSYNGLNQSLKPPSNVSKVLNNVFCTDCDQEQINAIWQECLNRGYVEKAPNRKVLSSRNIEELVTVRNTYYITEFYTVSSTDSNGIVTETRKSRQIPRESIINGQCRGSEYIWK